MHTASALAAVPRTTLIPIVAGLLLTLLLAALDATIVSTAMPSIATDLQGFQQYSWVSVSYLLASTLCVPIVGKLADQYGRRNFLLTGALLFLSSSVLCALAGTMHQLIGFRLLQGIGAGAITAAVFAAIPRLFEPAAGARMIGLFTGTYGVASIAGPLLGGVITDATTWRGVFWINVPIAVLALSLLLIAYPNDRDDATGGSVDYAGAITLICGMTPVLLLLLLGGRDLAWTSPTTLAVVAVGCIVLVGFGWIELRASEPIIPLRDLAKPALGGPVIGSALMNGGLLATLLFTPLLVQGVLGRTATQSGGAIAPMTTAWVIASVIGGQVIGRAGYTRAVATLGMLVAAFGLWLMTSVGPEADFAIVVRNLVIAGSGFGAAVSAFVLGAQGALPIERAGVAMALTTFARAVGATVATAVLGSVLVASAGTQPGAVVEPLILSAALHQTFAVAAALAVTGAVAGLLLRERPEFSRSARTRAARAGLAE